MICYVLQYIFLIITIFWSSLCDVNKLAPIHVLNICTKSMFTYVITIHAFDINKLSFWNDICLILKYVYVSTNYIFSQDWLQIMNAFIFQIFMYQMHKLFAWAFSFNDFNFSENSFINPVLWIGAAVLLYFLHVTWY
jgi:hypothetical protein